MTQAADPLASRDSLSGLVLKGSGNVSYYLRERIGEGGQGWVFRANWDDPAGHVVIVKVLRPDVVASEALRRFEREAEVLRMLSTQGRPNPYVVRFYDHAVAQVPSPFGTGTLALPFTVLEFVDGTNLEKILAAQRGQGLPAERVRRLVRQISQALDTVHAQKVVHRDLKPSNILLATEGGTEVAKVTDFGLVKLVDVNLHKTTTLAGASLGYAPPEQYEQGNRRVSPRTDVFSLAAVVFEMLTGTPAFPFNDGENPLLILTRILSAPRPLLSKSKGTLSPELHGQPGLVEALDREITRALAADPSARHESVLDFWSTLEPALTSAAKLRVNRGDPESLPKALVSPFESTAKHVEPHGRAHLEIRPAGAAFGSAEGAHHRGAAPSDPGVDRRLPGFVDVDDAHHAARAGCVAHRGLLSRRRERHRALRDGAPPVGARRLGPDRAATAAPALARARAPHAARRFHALLRPRGLVGRLSPNGVATLLPVADPEIVYHAAVVDDAGTTTLVGERPYRGPARQTSGSTAGVVVQLSNDVVAVVGDAAKAARLRGVARLDDGTIVACGDHGALVRVEMGAVEHVGAICGGHLLAIAPALGGGAVTVGAGGHALFLTAKLEARLEAVQTTKDMLALSTAEDGQAWAGASQARLLRRSATAEKSTWLRMTNDLRVTSSILAVSASAGRYAPSAMTARWSRGDSRST